MMVALPDIEILPSTRRMGMRTAHWMRPPMEEMEPSARSAIRVSPGSLASLRVPALAPRSVAFHDVPSIARICTGDVMS